MSTPTQNGFSLQDDEASTQFLHECVAAYERQKPNATRPAWFTQDLDYTHERLYRTVSGVVESDDPFPLLLDSARRMLALLRPSDFPREFQDAFTAITEMSAPSEDEALQTLRDLIELFFAISERVINGAALGNQYERPAWVVREAMEGRRGPFVSLFKKLTRRNQPIPPRMRAYIVRGQPARRHGRPSLHPARVRAIAWLVRDRLKLQRLEHPDARRDTSLNHTCRCLALLMEPSWQTIKKIYCRHANSFR